MSTTASSALPTFSYAQAAKGRPVSQMAPPKPSENALAPKESSSPTSKPISAESSKADLADDVASESKADPRRDSGGSTTNGQQADTDEVAAPLSNGTDTSNDLSAPSAEAATDGKAASMDSSPSFGTASDSTLPKDDEIASTPNESSESTSWDKQSQVSTSAEKSTQTADGTKEKDSETNWGETPTAPALKPAAVPVVNIWQQRKEAQEAKAKTNPIVKSTQPSQSLPKAKGSQGQEGPLEQTKTVQDQSKSGPKKKGNASGDRDEGMNAKEKRKPAELSKSRDEVSRKPGGRISRSPGHDKDKSTTTLPPPVGDAVSWPTPETAKDDDKKKMQDKVDKPEPKSPTAKAHSKNKWTPVPYVPSAIFVTPLPPVAARRTARGGRGGREGAGRGGHVSNHSVGSEKTEKPAAGFMGPPPLPKNAVENERGRDQENSSRSDSVPAQPTRASSAGQLGREQRKSSQTPQSERSHVDSSKSQAVEDKAKAAETEQAPQADGSAKPSRNGQESRFASRGTTPSHASNQRAPDATRQTSLPHESHSHPRYNLPDRRSMPPDFFRNSDNFLARDRGEFGRDNEFSKERDPARDRHEHPRDRNEFMKDREFSSDRRGRGGYRGGRNNNSNYTNAQPLPHHSFTAPLPQHTFPSKSHSYNERQRQQQPGGPNQSSSQHSQGHRPNPRSHPVPNNAYGQYPNGMHPGSQPLSPIQTDMNPMYGFPQQMHPASGYMSAVPYNPYFAQMELPNVLAQQINYYFSVDNLCRDVFLRKHMDSQGFVPFELITNFKRMKQLTTDVEMIRAVCQQLPQVEFRPGEDGADMLRKRDKWEQWVVPLDQRVAAARNEGPPRSPHHRHEFHFQAPPDDPQGYPMMGSLTAAQWTNGNGPAELPANEPPSHPIGNGSTEGHITQTPLSSEAPAFAPTFGFPNSSAAETSNVPNENVFPDEQILALNILVRRPGPSPGLSSPPGTSAASRTFSHGSMNGESMLDEQTSGRPAVGLRGGAAPSEMPEGEQLLQLRSPALPHTPMKAFGKPSFWVKNSEIPVEDLPDENELVHEPYYSFRARALAQREAPGSYKPDMDHLYEFLADFLVKNYNASIYHEFRELAKDDAKQESKNGVNYLVRYYDASLLSDRPLPDQIARDLVDFVKGEKLENRLAYRKLRTAWRNGAFNMKSRYKIDRIIDADLRAELEK